MTTWVKSDRALDLWSQPYKCKKSIQLKLSVKLRTIKVFRQQFDGNNMESLKYFNGTNWPISADCIFFKEVFLYIWFSTKVNKYMSY